MEADFEKSIITNSPDTLIETKLSKIPKAFSIENLIAKKSKSEIENEKSIVDGSYQQQNRIPPVGFSQNFPFYNPWAANYLMSNASVPQNLLLNASACVVNSQQLYHLQNDKLSNFVDSSQQQQPHSIFGYKEKFPEMLFNPISLDQNNSATYQLLHHHQQQQHSHPDLLASKLKDATFLNEFYTNYFMLENNRIMNLTINGDNNNVVMKRTKKDNCVMNDNCSNSSNINNNDNSNHSDYENIINVNDNNHKIMDKSGLYYEEDSSYSDLSVTMSPEELMQNQNQDKGKNSPANLIKTMCFNYESVG